jgi:hypothetical protein
MSNAIFQFFVGNPFGYQKCIKSINDYCKKYSIKHYVSFEKRINKSHLMFEKYQFLSLLSDPSIDRILYVDADIMATPTAQNIFEKYSDENFMYAYDENDTTDWMDRDPYIFNEFSNLNWPTNVKNKKQYFNAGLMLFSRKLLLENVKIFNFEDIPNWKNLWYFGDQTIINYWVVKNNMPFKTIDYSFNRMDLGNYDPNNDRYAANFIHYAGPCKYGNGNKLETMEADYRNLYGN